jgi:hypothetical protein
LRVRSKLLFTLIIALGATSASAKTKDASIIEGLGLDGRWSQNCHRPASADNPYLIYTAPEVGQPTERRVAPPDEDRVTELLDIQWKKTRELVWVIAEGEVMLTIVSKLDGNRMRVWSMSSTDGQYYIAKGLGQDGKPTPWISKCETN